MGSNFQLTFCKQGAEKCSGRVNFGAGTWESRGQWRRHTLPGRWVLFIRRKQSIQVITGHPQPPISWGRSSLKRDFHMFSHFLCCLGYELGLSTNAGESWAAKQCQDPPHLRFELGFASFPSLPSIKLKVVSFLIKPCLGLVVPQPKPWPDVRRKGHSLGAWLFLTRKCPTNAISISFSSPRDISCLILFHFPHPPLPPCAPRSC